AQGHVAKNVPDVAVGYLWRGSVEDHQEDTGQRLPYQHEGGEPPQAEGRINVGHFRVVETRPDMQPEAIRVGLQAWIRPAWLVAPQHAANVVHVETGRDPLYNIINFGDGGLLQPHLPHLINESSHMPSPLPA